jgi:protein O-mannosyl-transferase
MKGQTKKATPKKGRLVKQTDSRKNYFDLIGFLIIVVLGVIIYSNSFNCSFHFDDFTNIVNNLKIRDLSDIKSWWSFYPSRPVAIFSFVLNYRFNQLDVLGYHIVNLIIHILNALLIRWLTLLIFSSPAMQDHKIAKHKQAIALVTALLFVSHPLATQSVTYIVQRMSSMAAMFYMLSAALYFSARLSKRTNLYKILLFTASFISAVLAFFSKENAYTLPLIIILLEFFFIQNKKLIFDLKDYRLYLLIASTIGIIAFILFKYSFSIFNIIPPVHGHTYTITATNYLFTQFSVIVKYIQLLFLPINQMVDYNFPVSNNFFEIRTLLSFLVLSTLIALAVYLFKNYRMISFGIFWFFVTLAVESSFMPIEDVIFEHRTYLPSFGFFLIFSTTLFILLWNKHKYIAITIFALVIVSNSFLTFQRNKVWKDELSLWSDNTEKAPNIARPVANRGYAYRNLKQWDQAIADYSLAIKINPKFSGAYNNRGYAYESLKKIDFALADYSKAIEIDPKFESAYSNRGAAYVSMNQMDKAMADFSKAISIDPYSSVLYYNRGNGYESILEWNKAIADYNKSIELYPYFAEAYYNRGVSYGNLQQWDYALADYDMAKKIDHKFSNDYYMVNVRDLHFNRASEYVRSQQWEKAVQDFTSALEIDPNYPKAYSERGIAYARLEKWDNAIFDFSAAISLDINYKDAYFNRGNVYARTKQWEKAIADYSNVLKLDPTVTQAKTNIELAKKYLQTGNNQ